MQLTNDIKAKSYLLYIGCEIEFGYEGHKKKGILVGRDERLGLQVFDPANVLVPYHIVNPDLCKLILTPLSEITNEDAIEVANCIRPNQKWEVIRYPNHIYYLDVKCGLVTINIFFLTGKIVSLFEADKNDYNPTGEFTLDATDFLRSRGYALPYQGIDLFESGIAIKKS